MSITRNLVRGSLREKLRQIIAGADPPDPDTTPPVITLLGDPLVEVETGTAYIDAGATALDDVDGDITAQIVVWSNVNTETAGEYTVEYDVSDAAGNPAATVARGVSVIAALPVLAFPFTDNVTGWDAMSDGTVTHDPAGALKLVAGTDIKPHARSPDLTLLGLELAAEYDVFVTILAGTDPGLTPRLRQADGTPIVDMGDSDPGVKGPFRITLVDAKIRVGLTAAAPDDTIIYDDLEFYAVAPGGGGGGARTGVNYTATFATGQVQTDGSNPDGGNLGRLVDIGDFGTHKGKNVAINNATDYSRVVTTENDIDPAPYTHMLRMLIDQRADYTNTSGKTRTDFDTKAHTQPHDEFIWIGFRFYLPNGFSHDSENQILINQCKDGAPLGDTPFYSTVFNRQGEFEINTKHNPAKVDPPGDDPQTTIIQQYQADYAPLVDRWNDVVIRMRVNPFTEETDTSSIDGSTGLIYQGNRGSFEYWLNEVKVVDFQGPVGWVPNGSGDIFFRWDVYKGRRTWNAGLPDQQIIYFTGLRLALENDGAGYADVHPTQQPQPA